MADGERRPAEEAAEVLAVESAQDLPDRELMSLLDANVAIPVNAAVAANVLADDTVVDSDAVPGEDIDQPT